MSITPAAPLSKPFAETNERPTHLAKGKVRRRVNVSPDPQPGRALLGVELGATSCGLVFGSDGVSARLTNRMKVVSRRDPEAMLVELQNAVRAGIEAHGVWPEAIGVCCEGVVDARTGTMACAQNLSGWNGFPFADRLKDDFGVPVSMKGETDAHTLAEWRWGAGRGARNMIYLGFGAGMEAGLVLEGQLYQGSTGRAGEAGHLRVAEDGPENFGKRGSLGGFCSSGGMVRLARELGLKVMSVEEIFVALAEEHPIAARTVRITAHRLGCGLALMVDLLNPERIVIGGIFAHQHTVMMPLALQALQAEASAENVAACQVIPASLGESARGYAALAVAASAIA